MLKWACVRLMLLVAMLCVGTTYAQQSQAIDDENTIYWAKPGFEPLYIPSGALRNSGIGDLTISAIGKLLPQYQHKTMRANYIRVISELRRSSKVCAVLHKTPEREEFSHFSNPLVIIPSYQVYIHSSEKEQFENLPGWNEGKVSLNDLLSSRMGLRMAQTPSHSYGEDRDKIIRKNRKNLDIVYGYAGQKSLIKMLLAKRVDLILEFPWVVNHHLPGLKVKSSQLHKILLADVPSNQLAFIACPKSPWGKRVITALNNIEPPLHALTKPYVEKWLAPVEVEEYRRANREHFGEVW